MFLNSDMCFTFNSTGEQARFNTFGGSGDLDLFVKKGAPASTSNFDCKSDEPSNQEACTFNSNGLFYVYVKAISDVENTVLVAK